MINIKNTRVSFVVSDPWDFGTRHGDGPHYALIVDKKGSSIPGDDAFLLKLQYPIEEHGVRYNYVIATSRYADKTVASVLDGSKISCAMTLIPDEKLTADDPFDLSWWRGGGAFVGALELANNK